MKKEKTPFFAKVNFYSNSAIEKRLNGTWTTELKEEYAKLSEEMMEERNKEPKYVQLRKELSEYINSLNK